MSHVALVSTANMQRHYNNQCLLLPQGDRHYGLQITIKAGGPTTLQYFLNYCSDGIVPFRSNIIA